jgi:type II secretory pathway pseudopilin PulG
MRKRFSSRTIQSSQGGYALLLVVFMTMLMLMAVMVAAPSIRTERKREKEEEMIWRGRQYVRAIKLYYRKNGKFPTSFDDLTKPKQGSLRFLRQAYKDPMNKEDGSWRMIYVGPAGQLIGSLKPPPTLQAEGGANVGTPAAQAGFGSTQSPGAGASQSAFGPQSGNSFGSQSGSAFGTSTFGTASGLAGTTPGSAFNQQGPGGATSSPGGLSSPDASTIIGGNIIGIGSKVDRKSVIIYEKATNYHLFEFVWDPSKDAMGIGGASGGIGTPAGQAPGQGQPGQPGSSFGGSGFGQGFGQQGQNPAGTQPSNNPNPMPQQPPLNNPQQ